MCLPFRLMIYDDNDFLQFFLRVRDRSVDDLQSLHAHL